VTTKEPMDAVRQYVDAFNRGDVKTMASTFTLRGMILDGMAPHVWHGTTAAQDWYRDVLVEDEQHGVSGYVVTLSEPRDVTVTGDNAYVVVPLVHDIKSAQQTGHADWRDLYGGSPQAQRRVAHSGLGMGKRSIAAQMIASGQDFARDL